MARLMTCPCTTIDWQGNITAGRSVEIPCPYTVTPSTTNGYVYTSTASFGTGSGMLQYSGTNTLTIYVPPQTSKTLFVRGYFSIWSGTPSDGEQTLGLSGFYITLNATTGKYRFNGVDSVTSYTIDTALSVRLEMSVTVDGSNNATAVTAMVDGVPISTWTGSTAFVNTIRFGSDISAAATRSFTDVAVNDSTGSYQNSWPGDGRIKLLLPTANSSVGNWKSGTGTSATNDGYQWACINGGATSRPVGNATPNAAGSSGTAIGNNVSGAANAGRGDFTMATYASAGIKEQDTINCVTMVVVHGEDIRTGTKTGNFEILSNPAQGAQDTIGDASTDAYGGAANDAVGTYPSLWVQQMGTVQYPTSIAVATAPVCRVNKTDTGTRYADICWVALFVDYSPGLFEPIAQPIQRNITGWFDQPRRF